MSTTPVFFLGRILKPTVFHRKDRQLGNGIKVFPREALSLLETSPHLRWISEEFK